MHLTCLIQVVNGEHRSVQVGQELTAVAGASSGKVCYWLCVTSFLGAGFVRCCFVWPGISTLLLLASRSVLCPPGILHLPLGDPSVFAGGSGYRSFRYGRIQISLCMSLSQMVHSPAALAPVACPPGSVGHLIRSLWVSPHSGLPSFISVLSYGFLCLLLSPWGRPRLRGSLTALVRNSPNFCLWPGVPSVFALLSCLLLSRVFPAALPCLCGTCLPLLSSREFQSPCPAILFFQLSAPLDPVSKLSGLSQLYLPSMVSHLVQSHIYFFLFEVSMSLE